MTAMHERQHAFEDFSHLSPAAATRRFLADTAREVAAMNAIGTYVTAAGYTCSGIRGWNHMGSDDLECVCDLFIDDIRLGDMTVKVTFGDDDQVTGVGGSFGQLLDLRKPLSA